MSRINIYHGVLSGDRIEREIEGGITIRDALDGVDLSNSIILVNGSPCDGNRVLLPGDICDIRILPEGGEAYKGWNFIDSIMTVFTLGIWGIGSIITGMLHGKTWGKLLWDSPSEDPDTSTKSQEQEQQLPYISGAENRSLQGNPVPFIMGRHLLSPYYCGTPYTQISGDDGEDQYMYMLFMLGYSKLKVTDIKIGDQMLARNSGNVINGRIPMDNNDMVMYNAEIELDQSGSDLTLYSQTVYEEQVQIELLNTNKDRVFKNEPKRFSGRNPMRVEVELYIPSLLAYDDKGDKKDASVSVSIMYRWSTLDGSTDWKPFAKVEGSNSYSNGTSTITRNKARNMRFVAARSFSYNDIPRLDGELYPSAKVEIKVARESENPTDSKVQSQLYLVALRTWSYDYDKSKAARTLVPEKPVSEELMAQTARLAIKIKASEDLSGQIKQVNCVLQSYARVWDGNKWSTDEIPTSNPASICLKALQSNMLGNNRKSDSEIDLDSLGRLYEHCEDTYSRDVAEINAINKRGCKLECNGVVTTTMPLRDLLVRILASGRSVMTSQGLKFSVLFDGARSQFVTILNNQNVLSATNTKNFEKVVDGYKVKFIDQTDNWQENIMFVNFDDGTTVVKPNYEYEQIEMTYCTHRDQVWHNAMFEGAKRMYRKEQWKRTLSVDGAMLSLFDLVQVQDDTLVVGIGDGAEITSLEYDETGNYITAIQTDGHFNVNDTDKGYGLKIIQADGVNEPSVRVCKVETPHSDLYSCFTLATPIYVKERIVPSKGDIVAFGEYGKETINAFVVDKQAKGDGTYDITLMPYSDDVYKYEKNRIMPVFDSKINPPQPFAGIQELPQDYPTYEYVNDRLASMSGEGYAPTTPFITSVKAEEDGIQVSLEPPGTSKSDVIRHYVVEVWNGIKFREVMRAESTNFTYAFHRPTDGYPEAADLAEWRVRVKAVNIYGKESTWSDEEAIDTSNYLTWKVAAPRAMVKADRDWLDWGWPGVDMDVYGTVVYDLMAGDRVLAVTSENSYRYRFDRDVDGYPEKSDLLSMGLKVRARNEAHAAEYTLEELDLNLRDYLTWIPKAVAVRAAASETKIDVDWGEQAGVYGSFTYDITIDGRTVSRTTAHFDWYEFNRLVDGYPEKNDLAGWVCSLKIANEVRSIAVPFSIDTSRYLTWIPSITEFSVVASEDMVRTDWKDNSSDCYGVFRYTVSRDGVPVRSSMTQPPLNIGYNRDVDGYPEKDWFTHKYTLTVENQAHKVVSAETSADTTDYLTWKITPPAATATASEGEIALSWSGKSAGTYYGTPAYSVLVDGQKVAEGITSLEYTWQFDPEDRGWPEAADIDGWNIVLRAETEADSADVAVTVDTSAYLGYMPKAAPIARAEANGRLITVSWPRDTSVYGYTGAEVQVAKAYKLAGDVYTPITDEAELVWMKPAVGLNPYVSEDNYQDGTGSLVVARETVSLMVPLHGQATAPVPETMYAYRVATTTSKSSSPWTAPIYVIARPVSATDVVRAWNITDTGEKVKVDGALGANQIYVHDLAAISANLGMITDGMIAGSELNYWAINDVVDERGLISRFRGEWRVGDEEEYIQVSVRTDELGNPIPGRYKIKIAAGEYVVFAGDTEIHGKTFTFFDTEGNVIFQITPQSSYIAVKTGGFVSNYSRTAIQGLHPYAYQYGSFITQNKGETIYRRIYQDTHGVSRTGFFRVASGGDQLLDQLPSTLPCHQMCFQNGDKLYTMRDMPNRLDYTNYRFGLLDGSGTVFPDQVLGFADISNQGFFCPDRSAGWRRVSTVLDTREDYTSWGTPTGDGHLFRVIDNAVQVVSTLSGIQWKLSGILVKSAKYIGNHHILGTNTDGSIRRVWNLKDTSYFDLQLDEGDTPVYVVSPGNIWAKDADGQVWHYDAAGRTAASIRLESTPYIVAESYGTSVWWEVSQSIVRLNVLDGSSDEAEIPQGEWSVRIPTANYIVMINDLSSSMVLVGKWRLDKQTTMSLDTLQAFMPAGGDLVVQIDAMYNQAWVQLGEGADGNPEAKWLDPPVQMSLPTIVNHDIDLEAMTWTRNTFAFPSTEGVIPITGLSDNDKRLWTDGEHLYEQDGSALNNLGTIPLDSDAVPTRSFDLYAHQGYIYILKMAELATVVTRVHQATLDVSYAALPLAAADPMNPYPCVLRDGMLWVALKGNVLSNTQGTLFPEELDLLARAELGGLRWFGTLDEIQIGYSEVDVWTIQSRELTLIPTAGDGPYLGAVGLDKSYDIGATTRGLLVAAMEADSPLFSTWARYHGQADLIQTGMDIVPPGASCGIHEGVMVIAGYHYNLDTASATHMIGQHNISSPETPTGREVYETGVGFKSVFYDKLSGHYRYYMDTGACIEFDEDGNLISKGQEGAPGRDGLPGTKGEQGKGIQSTIPHYLASDLKTGVTYATPGWTTAPQQTTDSKKFLWSYLEFAYTDGTTVRTNPVVIGGEKGDRGEDGENAVISGVTATVDSGVGTPSVDVTMGGTELDRTFSFAFKNLKGNTGATGPQGPQGPKGDKGDTGATGPSVLKSFTMKSLGFTGGQDSVVQLADFLAALQSKMGGGGIALITCQNASSAKVTDGTTTISINGGHLVWGSTNAFPTSTWSTVTATYYPATDGSAWKMSAAVSGTAGTVAYKKIIALHAPAINHVYIQFRGQSAPTTLYPGTSWQNISSTYAGRFFRAEGGSAAAFGSQQAGGLPNITGYAEMDVGGIHNVNNSFSGALYKHSLRTGFYGDYSTQIGNIGFDAKRSSSLYGAAPEVRPINEAIRIWKRIS